MRLEFVRNAMGLIVFSEIVKFATNSRQPEHGFAIRLIGLYKCDFRAKEGGGTFIQLICKEPITLNQSNLREYLVQKFEKKKSVIRKFAQYSQTLRIQIFLA